MYGNIADKSAACGNAARMLRSGGRLVVSHPRGRAFVDQLRATSGLFIESLPTKEEFGSFVGPSRLSRALLSGQSYDRRDRSVRRLTVPSCRAPSDPNFERPSITSKARARVISYSLENPEHGKPGEDRFHWSFHRVTEPLFRSSGGPVGSRGI